MKQFAIIGLGSFGIRVLEELSGITGEIIILDKDPEMIAQYKDLARDSYIVNVINKETVSKIVPSDIDAAIVDLGSALDAAVLVTNYLHNNGVKEIIVNCEQDSYGEVLQLVGATRVVFPEREAAKSLVPQLASSAIFQYMTVSPTLVIAEIAMIEQLEGKTLPASQLRQKYQINVIAIRKGGADDFEPLADISYVFQKNDCLLVAGASEVLDQLVSEKRNEKKFSFQFFRHHKK